MVRLINQEKQEEKVDNDEAMKQWTSKLLDLLVSDSIEKFKVVFVWLKSKGWMELSIR